MTYDPKALGSYIRYQRRSWGLTQQELADNVGLKQKKISRIECGDIEDPGFFDVVRIAGWFGVTLEHVARMAGLA